MSQGLRITIILIIGLVLASIIYGYKWFHNNFAYDEVEETSGYSAEARRNKFLAAQFYLRELGFKVESDSNRARLLDINSDHQTILVNDYGPKLSPTHFKQLLKWMENGGHLILTANDFEYTYSENYESDQYSEKYYEYDFRNNQLLEEFGVIPRYTDFNDSLTYPEKEIPQDVVLKSGQIIKTTFSPDFHLIDINEAAIFSIKDQFGKHLLQFKLGNGKLTVLSDNEFLNNYKIDEHDHAYLLWLLSSSDQSASTSTNNILLLYNNETDSIFSLIWNYGKQACIAFFVFLVISLWSLRNRFGPILPNTSYSSRNIGEHLHAIARFSWRQDRGVHLLSQSREQCEGALLSRYPSLKEMGTQERLKNMADILDLAPAEVHSALFFEPKSTNEYINTTHNLQKIWIHQ